MEMVIRLLFMIGVVQATTCYKSETSKNSYDFLARQIVETHRGCEILCDGNSKCEGFAFKYAGVNSSCVLLKNKTNPNQICSAEATMFVKKTSGCGVPIFEGNISSVKYSSFLRGSGGQVELSQVADNWTLIKSGDNIEIKSSFNGKFLVANLTTGKLFLSEESQNWVVEHNQDESVSFANGVLWLSARDEFSLKAVTKAVRNRSEDFLLKQIRMEILEIVGIVLLIYSCYTLILYGLVVTAVIVERKSCTTGCLADTLSLINAFLTYGALTGFFRGDWIDAPLTIRAMQTIVWGSRLSQKFTVWMIAINRLTAIIFPLQYSTIWNTRVIRICTIIQLAALFGFGSAAAFSLNHIRIPSSLGGTTTTLNMTADAQQQVYLGSTILTFVSGIVVVVCYVMMILIVVWRKAHSQTIYSHERNLHWIAIVVCTAEILSFVQQIAITQFKLSSVAMNCIYLVGIFIYDSIPPYLLIIFSSNIRKRFISMLSCRYLTTRRIDIRRRSTLVGPMIDLPPRMAAPSLYSSNFSV